MDTRPQRRQGGRVRKQASRSSIAPAELAGLDLCAVDARTEQVDGGLVLVIADNVRRLHLVSGADDRAAAAIRGALRLAAGASAHARQFAAAVAPAIELETGDRHLPARPAWICVRCSRPWPCSAARRRLAAEFAHDPAALTLLVTLRLAEASADLGVAELPDLYGRFLSWSPTIPSPNAEER
ncbi:hypothetical protein KZZ52_00425 [Dactylosporangium sp. AC04546]|uniref:hypothetical protein n=1 Tax=Dactylosporangium sp. AC04546 TaxID=2862460 RepID=UPI001EDE6996|nr:hypothetical protein [Dactylosporangium sp. AC04546]WVK83955.1 hypothetical protein KZZ52_00425 [Dactylosporangium sp. AC04546]